FGLTAIKGLGRAAAEAIVRQRQEQGPYKDIFSFCDRVDLKIVSRAAIEKLIKSGAMDCFGARRAQLLHVLSGALQAAGELQQDRRHGQKNFFDTFELSAPSSGPAADTLPNIAEWSDTEKLKYEKEALDFYIS